MQKCENCNVQFSWGKIYRSFWWYYKPIQCDRCETEHRITTSGSFIFTSLTVLPMLVFGHFLSPFNSIFVTLVTGIVILMIRSLFTPFFVTFKSS